MKTKAIIVLIGVLLLAASITPLTKAIYQNFIVHRFWLKRLDGSQTLFMYEYLYAPMPWIGNTTIWYWQAPKIWLIPINNSLTPAMLITIQTSVYVNAPGYSAIIYYDLYYREIGDNPHVPRPR